VTGQPTTTPDLGEDRLGTLRGLVVAPEVDRQLERKIHAIVGDLAGPLSARKAPQTGADVMKARFWIRLVRLWYALDRRWHVARPAWPWCRTRAARVARVHLSLPSASRQSAAR
jgi:hypothetical protein